jgi:hypothetical protein
VTADHSLAAAAVPSRAFVNVIAHEEDPTSENWDVAAIAICANTG